MVAQIIIELLYLLNIFRYLLRNNANVAAVNNDGDLPFDICEEDDMEKLLQEAMDEQGRPFSCSVQLS